jgi:hypothetical protein
MSGLSPRSLCRLSETQVANHGSTFNPMKAYDLPDDGPGKPREEVWPTTTGLDHWFSIAK